MNEITFEVPTTIFKAGTETYPQTICPIVVKVPFHMANDATEVVIKREAAEMLRRIKAALPEWTSQGDHDGVKKEARAGETGTDGSLEGDCPGCHENETS